MRSLVKLRMLPVLIALLTFSMGVGVSYSWRSQKAIEDFLVETLSPDPPRDKFVSLVIACGTRLNSHPYLISTTGQSVERTGESFDSEDAAHNALVRKLSRADKILQRTVVTDHEGREGERAVAVFSSRASIFERYGPVLSTIKAPTVELALEFEATMEKNDR